jgi:hypothetical protein
MGQDPPGLLPQILAQGIVSVEDRYEQNITFSADGKECCFTLNAADWSSARIMMTEYRDGTRLAQRKTSLS